MCNFYIKMVRRKISMEFDECMMVGDLEFMYK